MGSERCERGGWRELVRRRVFIRGELIKLTSHSIYVASWTIGDHTFRVLTQFHDLSGAKKQLRWRTG